MHKKTENEVGLVHNTYYRKQKGRDGEDRACKYLLQNSFEILHRNWRTNRGEIDIIAYKDDTVVFVEVKALPCGTLETLSHELNSRKQKRIIETAKRFLINNRKYSNSYIRFDVILIDMVGFNPIHHIENAFSDSL